MEKSDKLPEQLDSTQNEDGSITINLVKPIIVFGQKKTEITLREPTGADYRKIGNCLIFDVNGNIDFKTEKVAKLAETLADLPAGTLDQLPYKQLSKIAFAMMPFFV